MEEKLVLSVIIVCYKSDEFIFDAVKSVLQFNDIKRKQLEIIIVDNGPADYVANSFIALEAAFGDELVLIHNTHNGGYGQGNNVGIERAKGRIVCIMNPDINFTEPVFDKVVSIFNANTKIALLGGKQFGHKDISFYFKPEYDFLIFTGLLTILFNRLNFYHQKYMFLSGALLFIDKDKFDKAGRFDEKIFLYCEEPDITNRLQSLGYAAIFNKKIQYNHLIDGRTDISEGGFVTLMKSTQYYFCKFNLDFNSFIRRKLFSYQMIRIVYNIFNKKSKAEGAQMNIERYQRWK